MGGHISSKKQDEFEQERVDELSLISKKFKKVDRRNVLLVGPPQSGKTQLFNAIIGREYSDQYEVVESAQLGYKVYSTNESRYEHLRPMSVHCVDTPGNFMRTEIAADYYFEHCDIVFIVMDISLVLDEPKIEKTTQFVLKQISMHHPYTRDYQKIPPLICHIFTKQDRVQSQVKKRNDKVIKQLQKTGILGNYLYCSTRNSTGLGEIKKAIMNADIENHGDKIMPEKFEKKDKPKETAVDPYEFMADSELPEIVPGMMGGGLVKGQSEPPLKGRRKSTLKKGRKQKEQLDDITPPPRIKFDKF